MSVGAVAIESRHPRGHVANCNVPVSHSVTRVEQHRVREEAEVGRKLLPTVSIGLHVVCDYTLLAFLHIPICVRYPHCCSCRSSNTDHCLVHLPCF